MDPVDQAELIKEAARIDPTTGRLPEDENDPLCDHCGDLRWTVLVTLTGVWNVTRRLCSPCTAEFLEWV